MHWFIRNRDQTDEDSFGGDLNSLTFRTLDPAAKPVAKINARSSWTQRTPDEFKAMLIAGRDDVLGNSAGLKHFGKRRLGRAGLDETYPVPDNVWDVDCSDLINLNVNGIRSTVRTLIP